MKRKGYCFGCNEFMDYEPFEEDVTETIKGKQVRFAMVYGRCARCGGLISCHTLTSINLRRGRDAYQKQTDLKSSAHVNT